MSETPERKVLKETIVKLRAKNLTSTNKYKKNIEDLNSRVQTLLGSLKKEVSKLCVEDKETADPIITLIMIVVRDYQRLIRESLETIDDIQLYVDVIESYSLELDKTLTEIFEQAKKYAEEKTQEQESISKDNSASYVQ